MIIRTKFTNDSKVPSYILEEDHLPIAAFEDFTTSAIVCRFVKGGRLEKPEYDAAVAAMKVFDATQRERMANNANTKQTAGLTSPADKQEQGGSRKEGGNNAPHANAVFV